MSLFTLLTVQIQPLIEFNAKFMFKQSISDKNFHESELTINFSAQNFEKNCQFNRWLICDGGEMSLSPLLTVKIQPLIEKT